jgi:hypothetical protein
MSEATRAWIYRVLTPVTTLLVAYGVVDDQKAALWAALVTALFSGGLAIKNTSTTAEG